MLFNLFFILIYILNDTFNSESFYEYEMRTRIEDEELKKFNVIIVDRFANAKRFKKTRNKLRIKNK